MFLKSALCLCLSFNFINCHQIYAGDLCVLQRTGENGSCQLLKDCASAKTGLKQGLIPQTCSFDVNAPIVCCVTESTPKKIEATTKKTVINRNPGTVGYKSLQKCIEFSKYVYTNYTVPTAFVGPDVVKTRDDCGFKAIKLIVGGTKAKTKEFPHMALIGYDNHKGEGSRAYLCGGSLISENYVLTAGHCLKPSVSYISEPKYVRVGDLNIKRNDDLADPQELNIIEIIKHPDYLPPSQYNDIALLKLEKNVQFNPFVRPICLNIDNIDAKTRQCIATGWGNILFLGPRSDDLMKVTLDLIKFKQCSESYPPNINLTNGLKNKTQICAGSEEAKDTCQGDSGGPIQIYHANVHCMYTLIGVTSFGQGCGLGAPGVYTNVYSYIEWIENTVWP